MIDLDALDFEKGGGLVTVVTQDARSGRVLMVAHADREAIERTLASGEMHYRSRSRGAWHKGATSGHTQRLVSLTPDCDGDALLARVIPNGPACHTGAISCFVTEGVDALADVDTVIRERAKQPANEAPESYTRRLLTDRNLRLKKLGEEAAELVLACADEDGDRAVEEGADLVYHLLVALRAVGRGLDDVREALGRRR
jgi:phosphoribosyl-ATP pyrophosphohydrolase/phosphoribosyl-AMP cyclohydrolase